MSSRDVEESPQPHGERPTISFFLEINMAVTTPQRNKRAVAEVPPSESSHRYDRSDHHIFILVKQPRAGGNSIQLEKYVHNRKSV